MKVSTGVVFVTVQLGLPSALVTTVILRAATVHTGYRCQQHGIGHVREGVVGFDPQDATGF
jgi:hypothetical protein